VETLKKTVEDRGTGYWVWVEKTIEMGLLKAVGDVA